MIRPDFARVDAILAKLPTDDAMFLSSLIEPGWRQRERRLAARDLIVAIVAGAFDETAPARQARALERALARYLASAWMTERHTGPAPQNRPLHRLATLNDGRGLGWRRIVDIIARTPLQ